MAAAASMSTSDSIRLHEFDADDMEMMMMEVPAEIVDGDLLMELLEQYCCDTGVDSASGLSEVSAEEEEMAECCSLEDILMDLEGGRDNECSRAMAPEFDWSSDDVDMGFEWPCGGASEWFGEEQQQAYGCCLWSWNE